MGPASPRAGGLRCRPHLHPNGGRGSLRSVYDSGPSPSVSLAAALAWSRTAGRRPRRCRFFFCGGGAAHMQVRACYYPHMQGRGGTPSSSPPAPARIVPGVLPSQGERPTGSAAPPRARRAIAAVSLPRPAPPLGRGAAREDGQRSRGSPRA
ncbi:hypothetical protein NDU88_008777 [Pleurodeles waltl]|uniref:Uncharacterized protein n=1 Tax=Pleurodeles waltl TaxID=8319 RepID=A0AAV7RWG8_PLEWA|nr:hypothetical protein NDU88_008777 [Pleurodeles waltl]